MTNTDQDYANLADRVYSGAEAINTVIAEGLVEPETVASDFTGGLSFESKAHVLFQLLGECLDLDADGPSRHGKAMLLELTDVMGPDYAQAFYRFAVMYTKLV